MPVFSQDKLSYKRGSCHLEVNYKQQGPGKQLPKAFQFTRGALGVLDPAPGALGRKAGIAQHQLDIGATREQPGAAEKLLAPVNRSSLAQCLVGRIGIA
jgi:hypothetical protein